MGVGGSSRPAASRGGRLAAVAGRSFFALCHAGHGGTPPTCMNLNASAPESASTESTAERIMVIACLSEVSSVRLRFGKDR